MEIKCSIFIASGVIDGLILGQKKVNYCRYVYKCG